MEKEKVFCKNCLFAQSHVYCSVKQTNNKYTGVADEPWHGRDANKTGKCPDYRPADPR